MKFVISFYDEKKDRTYYLTKTKLNIICWNDFPIHAIKFDTLEKAKAYISKNYNMFKLTNHTKLRIVSFNETFLMNFEKEVIEND